MYGSNYLWILPGYHKPDWWKSEALQKTNCTKEQMEEVLDEHLAIEFVSTRPYSKERLISNKVNSKQ